MASIQIFLIISTCFLYLVAAGLFSKAVWDFEINKVRIQSNKEVCRDSYLVSVEQHHRGRCSRSGIRPRFIRYPPKRMAREREYTPCTYLYAILDYVD